MVDDQRKQTRQQLEDIPSIERYLTLMERAKLTDNERKVCDMHYLQGWRLIDIGEELGFCERQIRRFHQKALKKLTAII